ncbi:MULTISPECIES: HD domain-containing protein [Methylorubrum]|uniref:HD domain-containing protein n=1 Tax=Methylorubrum TaxID=2282523 RepID=UPI00209EBB87|nr:HD superfamily phosphohydrolase [Methylorubrum zatmanii]MCP1551723.1 HD superfamily phosphohydrolase [Methylorubrum extorquens]MCP1577301.1 HD superfamily phosphohydrolase [Methylorubrum extorquens]
MADREGVRQRIRDPLHNLIEFDTSTEFEHTLWRAVQTRPFQRLRRIKQLGFSDIVYPGATHSRLAHSLGVFHTARRLMGIIKRSLPRFEESKANQALAAALIHDLGHGPFSHAFEEVGRRLNLKMAHHETVSDEIIRNSEVTAVLKELGSGFADDAADVIKGIGKQTIYSAVVSSQFDADRLDYMQRDRMMTGSHHAAIDFEWLSANLEIGKVPFGVDETSVGEVETFVLGTKAIHAAEAFVLGLFQLYPTIYYHKTTRGAEKLYTELLIRTISMIRDGSLEQTGLPENHPVVKFAKHPEELNLVLNLDDTVIWGALSLMADAKDGKIARISTRLRDRKLLKCIDVRVMLSQKMPHNPEIESRIDKICAGVERRIVEWSAEAGNESRLLVDTAKRSPYKPVDASKGPLERINIRTESGELADLKSRSAVVDAIKPFKLFRVYVDSDDREARERLDGIISGEMA